MHAGLHPVGDPYGSPTGRERRRLQCPMSPYETSNLQTHNLSVFGRRCGRTACWRALQLLVFSKGPGEPSRAEYGDAGISGRSPEFNDQAPAGDGGGGETGHADRPIGATYSAERPLRSSAVSRTVSSSARNGAVRSARSTPGGASRYRASAGAKTACIHTGGMAGLRNRRVCRVRVADPAAPDRRRARCQSGMDFSQNGIFFSGLMPLIASAPCAAPQMLQEGPPRGRRGHDRERAAGIARRRREHAPRRPACGGRRIAGQSEDDRGLARPGIPGDGDPRPCPRPAGEGGLGRSRGRIFDGLRDRAPGRPDAQRDRPGRWRAPTGWCSPPTRTGRARRSPGRCWTGWTSGARSATGRSIASRSTR